MYEAALGSAFGAALGYIGQTETNEMNRELTMSGRDFNKSEAEINRNWQATMSNSAYQRAVEDMKKAGLNPMLAYQHGGASTPTGAQGQAPTAIPMGNRFAAAAQSAGAMAQIENTRANTQKQVAETDRTHAEKAEIEARTPTHTQSIDVMKQNIAESTQRVSNMIEDIKRIGATTGNLQQQTTNLKALIPQIKATIESLQAHTTLAGAQTKLTAGQTAQAFAQAGLAGAQTTETQQRIKANLPALQSALGNLERITEEMKMPARQQDEAVADSWIGSLSAVMKALNPFTNIMPTVGIAGTGKPAPQPGRKDWKK